MLSHLTVRNLALVDRIALDFGPGLNVLTGETGAGKSVLVSALSLALGARAQSDVVRTGASEAVVEALFEGLSPTVLSRLSDLGLSAPDGQLLVRRVVSRGGRGRVQLNGQLATVGMLGQVMRGLLDITSQHEHVGLLEPDAHLDALDAYGELGEARRAVVDAYERYRVGLTELEALQADRAAVAARSAILREAIDGIETVDPTIGEVDELESEARRLRNQTELSSGAREAELALYSGEGSVIETVGRVQRVLERLALLDDGLAPATGAIASLAAELDDLAHTLVRYQGKLEADPARLDVVEERLQRLRGLSRRYGGDIASVLAARDEMVAELEGLTTDVARAEALEEQVSIHRAALETAAAILSEGRARAAGRLAAAIQRELAELSMDKAQVEMRLAPAPAGPRGAETGELLISPNPGEALRALRRTASGGEMSRLLLALKNVLADRSAAATYVFDEIDTGVGGRVAEVIGAKLRSVAAQTQVIAVTHLPQVAAFADAHFRVEKGIVARRTVTQVTRLNPADQVAELARMLGGLEITRATRSLAQEMRTRAIRRRSAREGRRVAAG